MKKILVCLCIFTSLFAVGVLAYHGPYTAMDIDAILTQGKDDQYFTMEGKFVSHVSKDDYVFEDTSGKTLTVEVDDDCIVQFSQAVKVYGEIDIKHGRVEVEIERIEAR